MWISILFFFNSKGLAQQMKFSEVQAVAEINTDAEEILPMISEDGEILYFSRAFYQENVGGDFSGSDIWWSEKSGDQWEAAVRAPNSVNNRDNNAVIGVNSNGNIVYLLNSYSRSEGIAFVEGEPAEWGKPHVVPLGKIDSEGFLGVYISSDFSVMLLSMERPDTRGREDLYVSLRDSVTGRWSDPLTLGSTINTSGFEISPFLSADKKYLFFASNGHEGFGDADIYVSRRLYERWDVWSSPVNLGPVINTPNFDAYFSMTADSTVYFSSNRDGGLSDIYRTRMEKEKKTEVRLDADKIIAEAEAILNELRETNVKEEALLLFEPGDVELSAEARQKLRDLTGRLKYTEYSSFHLLTVDPEMHMSSEMQKARIDEVKRFISMLGIGGTNIFDYPAAQQVTLKDGTVFKSAEGILIIVKD